MHLLGVDTLSILQVKFDGLQASICVSGVENKNQINMAKEYTYTTRFWDFHNRHPIAVCTLHLNIQFLVAHDKDDVDYGYR
jgi:hypothetical protein